MESLKQRIEKEFEGLFPLKSNAHIAVLMIQKKYFSGVGELKNSGFVIIAGVNFNFLSAPPATGQSAVRKILSDNITGLAAGRGSGGRSLPQ